MSDYDALDPKQAAERLRSQYESSAIFQAYCEAYKAIEENNISRCLFWREVIKILETDFSTDAIIHLF